MQALKYYLMIFNDRDQCSLQCVLRCIAYIFPYDRWQPAVWEQDLNDRKGTKEAR